jgi:6-phosphogluconolactonase
MNTSAEKFLYSGTETEITLHAATLIVAQAYRAIADHGFFSLVLAGGNSPRKLYRQLALGVAPEVMEHYGFRLPRKYRVHNNGKITLMPWEKTWLFWGDERSVPVGHPDSNYSMAKETLLSKASIPENHIFRMPAEKDDGEVAAKEYEETIHAFFQTAGSPSLLDYPIFDLVILGLGEDGHTASLFADNAVALQEKKRWVLAVNETHAKPPGKRLTLTLPVINYARNVLFFTNDKDKAILAKQIFLSEEKRVPASLVKLKNGKTFWFTVQL